MVHISAARLNRKPSALLPGGSAGVVLLDVRFAGFLLADLGRYQPRYQSAPADADLMQIIN